ncbi:MAG: ATP-binding protein [Clostridiales bacterium]|nr:ATP-binding protein [Clostridiales bacterium]
MQEARERGLTVRSLQPPDEKCEFCGKVLHHEGLIFNGKVLAWNPLAERCDCIKATMKWAEYDAKKKQAEIDKERQEKFNIQQARINKLLGASGIGKRFQRRMFRTFKADTPARAKAYQIAKEYADNFASHLENGTGLYIEGTNGTGKTHLAAAIAMQLMTEQKIPCICKTANDLLMDIKSAFDKEGVNEQEVLKVYKDVPLLIIDDLGKEQCTDWSVSTLYSIINDRYESMLPTIVTTNYNSDDLVKVLTPKGYDNYKATAMVSRLREVSCVLTMAWSDYRTARK